MRDARRRRLFWGAGRSGAAGLALPWLAFGCTPPESAGDRARARAAEPSGAELASPASAPAVTPGGPESGAAAGSPGAGSRPAAPGALPGVTPGGADPRPSAPPGAAPAASPKTAGVTSVQRRAPPALLRAVRTARHDGFDRVVFEFEGSVPGYHLEYVDEPIRDCGAGEVRPVAGDGWLEVRLEPAVAHTEAGQPSVTERERTLTLPILRELELTCDFEAVVTWVLGTASPRRYGVLELRDPPRLVVDIEH